MSTYNLIFAKLGPTSQVGNRPYRFASLVGACIGGVSTVLGVIAISLMLVLLPKEIFGQSAAAFLSSVGTLGVLFLGVFFIPFLETFLAQLLPLELAKMIGLDDKACVAVGAIVFGVGHYLNGGLAHGLCAAMAGALFTTGYVTMRPWGYFPAFWASYVAHALNNLLILYAVPFVFPSLG
ncbi:MAG: hypothetical protein V4476_13610 [Pseudomonadota bacterium]